jgi:AcrR family transcriptional regulator
MTGRAPPVEVGATAECAVGAVGAVGPRRSILAQDRSRRTRTALIDAALGLWDQRGYEAGFETTTVEEIARAAGVTKGTFYFHFASKVDILLERNAATEEAMAEEALRAVEAGDPLDVALTRAAVVLAGQSQQHPRAALAQIVREFHRDPTLMREHSTFRRLLPRLFDDARARGDLPAHVDPERIAALTAAILYSACEAWADGRSADLLDDLEYGLRVLLAGVRAEGR